MKRLRDAGHAVVFIPPWLAALPTTHVAWQAFYSVASAQKNEIVYVPGSPLTAGRPGECGMRNRAAALLEPRVHFLLLTGGSCVCPGHAQQEARLWDTLGGRVVATL